MTAIQYFWRHPLAEQVREEGREQGLEQGREEGLERGQQLGRLTERRQAVLNALDWRDIPVPDPVRERVNSCTDLDQLRIWAQRAVRATDAAELFAEE
ncbi:hypothetical protein AB0F30_08100 [Streptomyces sp. NPDC029006]|uniref:hypothetical protein n=1 Tax=Streptomyces sp. NPDC029006 TaxID=3155467 RepID=UPI0033C6C406